MSGFSFELSRGLQQGCQIFPGTIYQIGENVPNNHKNNQSDTQYIPNGGKIDQMAIKYTSIFQSKTLQNIPKLGFLV
jgi:hypothetical protein